MKKSIMYKHILILLLALGTSALADTGIILKRNTCLSLSDMSVIYTEMKAQGRELSEAQWLTEALVIQDEWNSTFSAILLREAKQVWADNPTKPSHYYQRNIIDACMQYIPNGI